MSHLRVKASDATLGAIVTGVRLSALAEADWSAIEAAFHAHAQLVFPEQHLTLREQVTFGQRFGEIEHLFGDKGTVPISNQRRDGSLLEDDEPAINGLRVSAAAHAVGPSRFLNGC